MAESSKPKDKSSAKEEVGAAKRQEKDFSPHTALVCVLAWLVPGAGHLYQGKTVRAALFFVAILGMLLGGLALEGKIYTPVRGQLLTYLATFACMGNGPSFFLMKFHPRDGNIRSATFEYGTTFILAAGLLNMLIMLDAYDVFVGRKD